MPFTKVARGTKSGRMVPCSADGVPEYRPHGITIDWDLFPANATETTIAIDETVVPANEKYAPFGLILAEVTQREVQTVTITGTPTGGTFTLTYDGQTTAAIAYNATAAAVQTALQALSNIGVGGVTVGGGPGPGTPYTVTFNFVGNPNQMTATGSFTGGTSPAIAVTTTTAGGTGEPGKYGPFDAGATDGRQTLTRGKCCILNYTHLQNDLHSEYPQGVFDGGMVYTDRLKKVSGGAYVQATKTDMQAAFPRIIFRDSVP